MLERPLFGTVAALKTRQWGGGLAASLFTGEFTHHTHELTDHTHELAPMNSPPPLLTVLVLYHRCRGENLSKHIYI
jgi:hypothetical protein